MLEAMMSCKKAPTAPAFADAADVFSEAMAFYRSMAEGMDQIPLVPSPGYSNGSLLSALLAIDVALSNLALEIAITITRTPNAVNYLAGFGKNLFTAPAPLGTLTKAIIHVGAVQPKVASGSMGDRMIAFNLPLRHDVFTPTYATTGGGAAVPMQFTIAGAANVVLYFRTQSRFVSACFTADQACTFAGVNTIITESTGTACSLQCPSALAGSTVTITNNTGNVATVEYYAIGIPNALFPALPIVQVLPPAAWLENPIFANATIGPESSAPPSTVQAQLSLLNPADYDATSRIITRFINFEFALQYLQ